MRYFVAVVIVLFALYGSLNATYGQVPPEQISLFPEIPSRPNVSHTPKHDQAIATFEAANKGWEVRRNVRSRTPRSMLGPPRFVPGATPEIIARNFLKENRGLLNMTAKTSHLSLLRIDEHEGAVHVSFQQDYRGIPVEGAVYGVHLNTIAHEYMHFITEVVTHDGLNFGSYPRNQTRALDEAFSDFFGCMYADSPVFGEYVQRGPGGVRNLDNSYTMSDWGTVGGLDNDYWSGSQIFSGALWDIREMFGKGHATKAVYSGLRHLNFADPDFVDARDAIVAHATTIYYPGTCALKNIFASRGIGSPCSGSSSVVANKDTGLAGQDANTSAMSGMSLTAEIPETYVLGPSAPNPTLHRAVVRYGLPKAGHVVMVVYDALGREIVRSVDEYKGAGFHSVTVETGDLPAGLYFYSLQVDTFKETRAMVVFK